MPARQQRLARHLAEAAEADDERAAVQVLGGVDAVHGLLVRRAAASASANTPSGVSAMEMTTMAVRIAVLVASNRPTLSRRGIEHEGEFAALLQQHGAVERLAVTEPEQPRDDVDARRLGEHEGRHDGEDQRPVARDHAEIERHADAEEEQRRAGCRGTARCRPRADGGRSIPTAARRRGTRPSPSTGRSAASPAPRRARPAAPPPSSPRAPAHWRACGTSD